MEGHCLSQSTVDKLTLLKAKFASQGFYQGLSSNVGKHTFVHSNSNNFELMSYRCYD